MHTVLPDGCVDIVFINNEPPATEPLLVKFSAGTRVCGVRLRPGCASAVLGVPAVQLLNLSAELSAVWGMRRRAGIAVVAETPTLSERRAALSEALIADLRAAKPVDDAVVASISWLSRHNTGSIRGLRA